MLSANHDLILLLPYARSGTTWLANILDVYPHVVYRHEPFSRLRRWAPTLMRQQFAGKESLSQEELRGGVEAVCKAHHETCRPPFFQKSYLRVAPLLAHCAWLGGKRSVLAKKAFTSLLSPRQNSPFALLVKESEESPAISTLVATVDPRVILILRRRCGVVASILRGLGHMRVLSRDKWLGEKNRDAIADLGFHREDVLQMTEVEFTALRWLLRNQMFLQCLSESHAN